MIDFKEDKYFDPESKKFYSGVFVSAYVSKGAQDTWEKVLDGTLTGFSIGGRMNKWDDAYDEKSDTQIRIIKEYDLVELSLVDSPANQFANIVSVEKVDGIEVIKADETVLENVFYDKEAGLVLLSENDSEKNPITGDVMENIGFVEKTDNEKTDMVKFLVDSAKGINTSKINKEVNPMTETTNEVVEEIVEKSDATVVETQVAPEAIVEESADAEKAMKPHADEETPAEDAGETPADEKEEDKAKKSDDVAAAVAEIKDTLTSAFSDLVATVKSLQSEVESLKVAKADVAEVKSSFDAVAKDIASVSTEFNEFGKRVDAVEADTAFRKSGDLGEIVQDQPETVEKSLWGGRFLKTADLFN